MVKVIGVDVSPHMKPDDTPENLWLQVSSDLLLHPLAGKGHAGLCCGETRTSLSGQPYPPNQSHLEGLI